MQLLRWRAFWALDAAVLCLRYLNDNIQCSAKQMKLKRFECFSYLMCLSLFNVRVEQRSPKHFCNQTLPFRWKLLCTTILVETSFSFRIFQICCTWGILFRTLGRANMYKMSLFAREDIFWLGVKHEYSKNSCKKNSVQLDVSLTKVFQNDAVSFRSFSPYFRIMAIKHQFGQQEIN